MATRKDVDVEVCKWLAGARDRDGGRKARNNKDSERPQTETEEIDTI